MQAIRLRSSYAQSKVGYVAPPQPASPLNWCPATLHHPHQTTQAWRAAHLCRPRTLCTLALLLTTNPVSRACIKRPHRTTPHHTTTQPAATLEPFHTPSCCLASCRDSISHLVPSYATLGNIRCVLSFTSPLPFTHPLTKRRSCATQSLAPLARRAVNHSFYKLLPSEYCVHHLGVACL